MFEHYEWGADEDGAFYVRHNKLPSHTCTREELGLEGDSATFLPLKSSQEAEISFYQKKFLCMDPADINIYGDFNSAKARLLKVRLEKCHDEDYCQSESDITSFLRNKWLMLMYSQARFDPSQYGDYSIVPETIFNWL